MTVQQQQALDSLYAIDNIVTIKITMNPSDWDALRTEEPKGGRCNFNWTKSRYTWRKATSVEISGTQFPQRTTFTKVGVKKKSFCGSFSNDKPCLHVDLGKYRDDNIAAAESLIGTQYLTLNNSIQDPSYIRQPVGYKLFDLAGLPHSRCNFARVFVNGVPIGEGIVGVDSPGVYVNAEPIMPRYIERNFDGNMNGNLYELEHGDDLVRDRLPFIGVEDVSKFEDRADLKVAIDRIDANGVAGASEVIDMDQFIRLYAMDFFLKHWDGYSRNTNNTYLYNDVNAVAAPGVGDVKLKFIPWGVDQILQPPRSFRLETEGRIAKLVREDDARLAQLTEQVRTYRETVFGRAVQQSVLKPMIDGMEKTLVRLGVPDAGRRIAEVRRQLQLATSAGYLFGGVPAGSVVHVLTDTGECLHASNTEAIPAGAVPPVNFEVVHQPLAEPSDDSDLWTMGDLGVGKSLTSRAYGRVLHASAMTSSRGHKLLYTCAANNTERAEEFTLEPVRPPNGSQFAHTGYFRLLSARTGRKGAYGDDATPSGRPRVYQDDPGSNLSLY